MSDIFFTVYYNKIHFFEDTKFNSYLKNTSLTKGGI